MEEGRLADAEKRIRDIEIRYNEEGVREGDGQKPQEAVIHANEKRDTTAIAKHKAQRSCRSASGTQDFHEVKRRTAKRTADSPVGEEIQNLALSLPATARQSRTAQRTWDRGDGNGRQQQKFKKAVRGNLKTT